MRRRDARGNVPPYVSYQSFKTLIGDLKEHGIPSRIDRSVLRRFSGVVGTQLLSALRFLRLIDDQSHPTPRLTDVIAAFGTADWEPRMTALLRDDYGTLFELDLANATASHFDETFRRSFPGADSVLQKSVAFFLAASKDGGVVISDRVVHGRKLRTTAAPGTPRSRKPKIEKPEKPADGEGNDNLKPPEGNWENRLIAKFPEFNPEWDAAVQEKWFESFEKLMTLRK